MTNPDVVVETEQLTKRYGEFTALDSLSISVRRGEILGFIGPNGAGKTTCIKILVGPFATDVGASHHRRRRLRTGVTQNQTRGWLHARQVRIVR